MTSPNKLSWNLDDIACKCGDEFSCIFRCVVKVMELKLHKIQCCMKFVALDPKQDPHVPDPKMDPKTFV